MNFRALYVLTIGALLLSACVTQPKPLQGAYAETTPEAAMQGDSTGAAVRWGGRIVSVEPRADSTCFEMISSKVGADARPSASRDNSNGRFLACRAGFYDPAVFEQGREVTLRHCGLPDASPRLVSGLVSGLALGMGRVVVVMEP